MDSAGPCARCQIPPIRHFILRFSGGVWGGAHFQFLCETRRYRSSILRPETSESTFFDFRTHPRSHFPDLPCVATRFCFTAATFGRAIMADRPQFRVFSDGIADLVSLNAYPILPNKSHTWGGSSASFHSRISSGPSWIIRALSFPRSATWGLGIAILMPNAPWAIFRPHLRN